MKMRESTAILLTMIMILSAIAPCCIVAAQAPIVSVQSVADVIGTTVDIDVIIEGNPGILGATLKLEYSPFLNLKKAESGAAFSALSLGNPASLASPCKFVWAGAELNADDVKDGTILSLQFEIDEAAQSGEELEVNLSYESGDVFDADFAPVELEITNGIVRVLDYLPGDLDGNGNVNSKDIVLLRRHMNEAYEQTINEMAADVNDDGKINSADLILIRRYIVGGYNAVLKPSTPKCSHSMESALYKAPTCTENGNIAYWSCSNCNKYYSDKNGTTEISLESTVLSSTGHTIVIDSAVAPTYTSTGLTEGKHCSVCSEVIVAQETVPMLKKDEYSISYYINSNDDYLESIDIENPNPAVYTKQDGLELQDLHVDGYNFIGWFTAQTGGTHVTEFSAGTTGNKTLYAHWEKVTYTVQFASDMVPQADMTFTTGQERTLPKPILDRYTFVGWSDKEGKMWDSIPVGTAKNLVLYANWASNRNRAVAVKKLAEPIICEDSEAGLMLFTYEIGEITNVPLYEIMRLNCVNGLISSVSTTTSQQVSSTQANTIAQTISNATTNSSSWSLENSWNNTTEVSQTYLDQTGQTREEAESLAKNESNTYNLSTSNGGAENTTETSTGSFALSGNKSHSDTSTTETGQNFDLSVDAKFSNESSIGAEPSIEMVKLNAENKFGFEIGAGVDYGNYIKNTNSGTDSWSKGVDFSNEISNTTTEQKNWNTSEGYANSKSTSSNSTIANAVSKLISEEYGYGSSYAEGGSNSSSQALASTDSKSDEYSTTMTYYTSTIESVSKSVSTSGETFGDYRYVMAGTVHVFAVVGYDVAEKTYFVYTYNVLDENTYEYVDYSFDGTFNDYETSIIPFEVPYFVNDYVNTRIAKTSGLQIDPDTGIITGYTPNADNPDTIVVIPSYISIDNGDGTYKAAKVEGIASGLFKNNTRIKGVKLSNFIKDIPQSAFEGCSSLEYVITPGVTKIGNSAFAGCTSLNKFSISEDVTALGTNAFNGVPEISAVASNVEVAQAVAECGAQSIVLDISVVPESELTGKTLEVGNITSFELQGKDKEYSDFAVKSNASTTVINGVKFADCTDIPMELGSENITLNRVTADAQTFALVIGADNANVKLNQTVTLASSLENAVLCKNVNFAPLSSSVVGKMTLSGNMLIAGSTVSGENLLIFNSGEIKYITETEFENYRNSCIITFDANGGSVGTESKSVLYNTAAGELPVPTYGDYTFLGWYTNKDGGTQITSETIIRSDGVTAYAKWNNWGGNSAEPAYNASTKTYTVTNGNELAWVSGVTKGSIKSGTNFPTDKTFSGYTIELANDIYLNDTENWENWKTNEPKNRWVPIGTSVTNFSGSFNGNDYAIIGVYVPRDSFYQGIFGYISNSNITNLSSEKSTIMLGNVYFVPQYAGGIVGYAKDSYINNCVNAGKVMNDSDNSSVAGMGGIVGYQYGGEISNCYNTGDITSKSKYTGGIVGKTYGRSKILSSYNLGDIETKGDGTGGVVGYGGEELVIKYCHNSGTITSKGSYTGGIVGISDDHLEIRDSYNLGDVTSGKYYVGGIVGRIYGATLYRCHNNGDVSGKEYVGGIVGQCWNSSSADCSIKYCYNKSAVSYEMYGGGVVGYLERYYIDDNPLELKYCYANKSTLYNEDAPESVDVYSVSYKSASELKNLSNLSGFSSSYWAVDSSINGGYPYLKALEDSYK